MNLEFTKYLKTNKIEDFLYYLTILFSFLIIVFWSFHELSILGADFGTYYVESRFANNDFILYRDIFDHKGPAFFYFLKQIGEFIGWGEKEAIFSIFLSTLLFFIPLFYLIHKFLKKNLEKILLILMSTCLLIGQDASSSIAFFQEGLLIISLSRIIFFKKNLANFTITVLFFWLSCFTRVDSFVFFPLIVFHFIRNLIFHKQSIKRFLFSLVFILLPILIFNYFSNFFGFNFNDYWIHNIEFNQWYSGAHISDNFLSKIQHLFFRPNGLLASGQSLIVPYLIFIFINKIREINFIKLNNFFLNIKSSDLISFNSAILIISLISYIITESDKIYYILIFLCPSLLILIKEFSINNEKNKLLFLPTIFFLISLNTSNLMQNIKVVFNDLPIEVPYQRTIEYTKDKNIDGLEIIGGQGWHFILSEKKPIRSIVDSWIYKPENPFITKSLLEQHKLLLNQNSGYKFWIANGLLKYKDQNKYLKEIILNSKIIEDQGYFSMYKIR